MRFSWLFYAPSLLSSILSPGSLAYRFIGSKKVTGLDKPVNAQSTSTDDSVSKCFSNPDVESIDESLKGFAQNLKAFVASGEFTAEEFEWSAQKLEKKLVHLVVQVERYQSCHELVEQLQFVKHVYKSMVIAEPSLVYYDTSGNRGLQLTTSVIGLNVAILGLFDSYGCPDHKAEDYPARVYSFIDIFELRRLEFDSLNNVPFSIRYVFQEQILQADRVLELLESYISEARE